MSVTRSSSSILALVIALSGCDGAPPADPDAGPPDAGQDAGPPDGGPPLTCTEMTRVDGVLDDTVTVMLDTTMTETRPRDLGLACGNVEGELRWAPQEVLELHVPGTGEVQVELDTVFDGDTDADFNTVLQVRETCETVPAGGFPPTCFDDAGRNEFRTRGGFIANGGDTLYLIVTGYSEPPAEQGTVDSGRVRVDITVSAPTRPTVTGGAIYIEGQDTRITAIGNDPGADARGVALNFYVGGRLLDIYGDGEATEDGDVFLVPFEPAPTTADYTGNAVVPGAAVNLAGYLQAVGATHARFRVYDAVYAVSEPLMVAIGEPVGFGETCDATHVCDAETTCVSGTCGARPGVEAACTGAAAIPVLPDGAPVSVTGTLAAGAAGQLRVATCVPSAAAAGAEAVYSATVPADTTADLIVTTDVAGTPSETDTIVYVRAACPDASSELGCHDDVNTSGMNYQSTVEARGLAAGTYFVIVETYNGGGGAFELQARLRPVLDAGVACDPAGMANRCATGTCPAGTDSVCPPVP